MKPRLLFPILALLLAAGCGSSDKKEEQVAELVAIDNPQPVRSLWEASVGAGSGETRSRLVPFLDGARIYAADHEGMVSAWDATTGERLWRVDTELPISGGPGAGDNLVLVGTTEAELVALNAADGSEKWRIRLSSEVQSVPKADHGVTVVHTIDGKLFGILSNSGTELWRYERDIPVLTLQGSSSPVISGHSVICGFASGKLAAIDLATGALLWEASVALPHGRSELERMVDIDGDPVVQDNTVFVATYQGNLAAISEQSGGVYWRRELSSYQGLTGNWRHLYVTDDTDQLLAVDPQNGHVVWSQQSLKGRRITAPAVIGDKVVVGDAEGYLHWFAQEDGHPVARHRVDKDAISTQPIVRSATVYALSDDGTLAAVALGSAESAE